MNSTRLNGKFSWRPYAGWVSVVFMVDAFWVSLVKWNFIRIQNINGCNEWHQMLTNLYHLNLGLLHLELVSLTNTTHCASNCETLIVSTTQRIDSKTTKIAIVFAIFRRFHPHKMECALKIMNISLVRSIRMNNTFLKMFSFPSYYVGHCSAPVAEQFICTLAYF